MDSQKQEAAQRVYEAGELFIKAIDEAKRLGLTTKFSYGFGYALEVTEQIRYIPEKIDTAPGTVQQGTVGINAGVFGVQGVRG